MPHRLASPFMAAAVACLAGLLSDDGALAQQVVAIHLRGYYYPEPATVQLVVSVEPQEENRLLRIAADSLDMYRATEVELAGEDDKRLHTIVFKNLIAGSYVVRAEVLSSTHRVLGQAIQELVVTSRGGR